MSAASTPDLAPRLAQLSGSVYSGLASMLAAYDGETFPLHVRRRMDALVYTGPETLEFQKFPAPTPVEGEAVIEHVHLFVELVPIFCVFSVGGQPVNFLDVILYFFEMRFKHAAHEIFDFKTAIFWAVVFDGVDHA